MFPWCKLDIAKCFSLFPWCCHHHPMSYPIVAYHFSPSPLSLSSYILILAIPNHLPDVPRCSSASLIDCPIVHRHPPLSPALPKHVQDIPKLEKVNLKSENYQGTRIRHVLEFTIPKKREVETLQIYISHMFYISVYDIHWW
jgi:hypothetical protein